MGGNFRASGLAVANQSHRILYLGMAFFGESANHTHSRFSLCVRSIDYTKRRFASGYEC